VASGADTKAKAHRGDRKRPPANAAPAGLAAREAAVHLIAAVMGRQRSLDEALAKEFASEALAPRDRALARLIVGTVLRHAGELKAVVSAYLEKPPPEPSGNLWPILLAGAAQLLFLGTPPHAAVGLAVEQSRLNPRSRRYDRLINAILRRVSREGTPLLQGLDAARLNIPDWLFERWSNAYGEADARRIALASLNEAPLDLSVKSDPELWAERLGGIVLPTGSVRLAAGGRIEDLPGYADDAWWVQDAAAALPVRLLGDVAGRSVADLCAAPGGKTAELAAAGARVTAVELSAERIARLRANLDRLRLEAELVEADAATWAPGRTFDAVLLDAPCTATGTIRRHPDILHLKRPSDIAALAELQSQLLDNAVRLVRPGGVLVYCTCSLEPEEGPEQIARLLSRTPQFARQPVAPGEYGIPGDWITADGDLRTLPFHLSDAENKLSGLDGFYAARLIRRA
jgi:16S rRNA (cytosine967-C5)-methyltransferase